MLRFSISWKMSEISQCLCWNFRFLAFFENSVAFFEKSQKIIPHYFCKSFLTVCVALLYLKNSLRKLLILWFKIQFLAFFWKFSGNFWKKPESNPTLLLQELSNGMPWSAVSLKAAEFCAFTCTTIQFLCSKIQFLAFFENCVENFEKSQKVTPNYFYKSFPMVCVDLLYHE